MASNDEYAAYESPLKKSKIKDGFNGEGPDSESKVAGSSVAEQLEDEDNKEEINCNMASEDKYHLLEDIDPLAWHYDSENEDHVKLLEDFICQYKESDGFDFIPLPGRPILSGIAYPVYLDLDTVYSNGCQEALKYAIEKENEKGANLIFERIDHANMHPPGLFFITFESRNETTSKLIKLGSFAVHLPLLTLKLSFSGLKSNQMTNKDLAKYYYLKKLLIHQHLAL